MNRTDPTGLDWLDSYANWFNENGGSAWSETVGQGIYSGATVVGMTDEYLATMTANEALGYTAAVAVPTAICFVFGGEILLGVGSAPVIVQELRLYLALMLPSTEAVVLPTLTTMTTPVVATETLIGLTGTEVVVTTVSEATIWVTGTTSLEASFITFTGTGPGTIITTTVAPTFVAEATTLAEYYYWLIHLGGI